MAYAITGTDANADRDEAMQLLERESEATGVQLRPLWSSPRPSSVARGLQQRRRTARMPTCSWLGARAAAASPALWARGKTGTATLDGTQCAVAIAPVGYADTAEPIATIGVGYCETPDSEAALAVAHELARTWELPACACARGCGATQRPPRVRRRLPRGSCPEATCGAAHRSASMPSTESNTSLQNLKTLFPESRLPFPKKSNARTAVSHLCGPVWPQV